MCAIFFAKVCFIALIIVYLLVIVYRWKIHWQLKRERITLLLLQGTLDALMVMYNNDDFSEQLPCIVYLESQRRQYTYHNYITCLHTFLLSLVLFPKGYNGTYIPLKCALMTSGKPVALEQSRAAPSTVARATQLS